MRGFRRGTIYRADHVPVGAQHVHRPVWAAPVLLNFLLVAICSIAFLSSCTAVGTGIGVIADARSQDKRPLQIYDIADLPPGIEVLIIKFDSTLVTGKFFELSHDGQTKMQDENLPTTGDTLSVVSVSGEETTRIFMAFGDSTLILRTLDNPSGVDVLPRHIAMTINSLNQTVTGKEYEYYLSGLSPRDTLIVDADGYRTETLVGDIDRIMVPKKTNYTKVGFISGLALDLVAITIHFIGLMHAPLAP